MTQDEIKALNDALAKGTDTLSTYIKGLKVTDPVITLDGVKKYLEENEEGKTYLQSTTDKRVTDGVNTAIENFKKEKVPGLIDDEIKKRYPDKDPKDKAIEDMKAEMEKMKAENLKKDLTNKALKVMTEKKLPADLVNFMVGADESTTKQNIDAFSNVFSKHDEALKAEILKGNAYIPPSGGGDEKPRSIGLKLATQNKDSNVDLQAAKDSYFK